MRKGSILVTGGLGYIGSHTVVALQERGFEVVVADDLSNSRISVLEGIAKISGRSPSFYQLDLCEDATELFEKESIEGVIHFAAHKAVGESVHEPLKYFKNNLGSLLNVLGQMQRKKIQPIIFSSSCTVYGQADALPISESSPLKTPESPYGKTKAMGEEILKEACRAGGIEGIALRYFNPIGAHESAHIGELPMGVPDNLVPYITQTAVGIREQLSVFGKDYDTHDGTCIRDYIHVCDLAEAHVIAMERLLKRETKDSFEVYNLGTGMGFSVLELVHAFEKVSGKSLNYRFANRREGDITAAYADTTKANKMLGWKAKRNIDQMLLSSWEWQLKLKNDE